VALPTLPEPASLVTLGVVTHAETHVAAALDQAGTRTVPPPFRRCWAACLGGHAGARGPDRGGRHRQRRRRAGALTARPWSRSTGPTGPPDGARARPMTWPPTRCRPARPRPPQGRRRPGGDAPLAAPGPPLGSQGPHAGRHPAQRAAVTAPDELGAQLRGLPLAERRARRSAAPARPAASHAHRGGQVRAAVGRRSLVAAHRGARQARRAAGAAGRDGGAGAGRGQRRGQPDGGGAAGRGPGTTPSGCAARAPSRTCAGWRQSLPHPARPPGIGCAVAATGRRTRRCT
jgi:hypothetical protein